ncbi:MAG: isoprenyl transferase [Bacteroidia bacterium]|nr:isoprenyl transferase [Bacteroidia bacterium]
MPATLKEKIDHSALPEHIAIIMDGNGRWAKQHGKIRTFGHQHGVEAVRDTAEACAELGIKYLTLYAFSTENWVRPKYEVNALMTLLVSTISAETKTLLKNKIRLLTIGDISKLPADCRKSLNECMEKTKNLDRMNLVLALNYSSKWEIAEAARTIAGKVEAGELKSKDVDEKLFASFLSTAGMPDPELLIRTSGEYRISNFLLWQIAYAELHFTPVLWPDFRRNDVYQAIIDFQKRERRFGGIKPVTKQHA